MTSLEALSMWNKKANTVRGVKIVIDEMRKRGLDERDSEFEDERVKLAQAQFAETKAHNVYYALSRA